MIMLLIINIYNDYHNNNQYYMMFKDINYFKNMNLTDFNLFINLSNIDNLKSISNIKIDLNKLIQRVGLNTLQNISSHIYKIQLDFPKCNNCNLRVCNCNTNLYQYNTDKINPIHINSVCGILNYLECILDELKNPYDDNVFGSLLLEIKLLEMGILVDTNIYTYRLYNRNEPLIVNNIRYINSKYTIDIFLSLWGVSCSGDINRNIGSVVEMEYSIIQFLVNRGLLKSYWLDVFDYKYSSDTDIL